MKMNDFGRLVSFETNLPLSFTPMLEMMSFASSPPVKRRDMNNKNTSLESQTNWERLEAMDDEDIDLSDIPELTEEDFKRAKPAVQFFKERGIKFDPNEPLVVTEYQEDGTAVTYELPPPKPLLVTLDPDLRRYFPDSESVNRTLRSLIALIPKARV